MCDKVFSGPSQAELDQSRPFHIEPVQAQAIELVDHGLVSLDGLITSTYPLSEGASAFDALVARSGLKIIVKPTE